MRVKPDFRQPLQQTDLAAFGSRIDISAFTGALALVAAGRCLAVSAAASASDDFLASFGPERSANIIDLHCWVPSLY
ncbi:hypothetical protein D3C83_131160 [compost metagenome]